MALTSDKVSYKIGNTERSIPVKASTKIYRGAMVAIDASGWAVPVTVSSTLECLGVAIAQADNTTGSNGDIKVQVEIGIFPMANSADADELTKADLGAIVYGVDDTTVAKTSNSDARSAVGTLWAMDSLTGLPLVRFG